MFVVKRKWQDEKLFINFITDITHLCNKHIALEDKHIALEKRHKALSECHNGLVGAFEKITARLDAVEELVDTATATRPLGLVGAILGMSSPVWASQRWPPTLTITNRSPAISKPLNPGALRVK